MRTRKSKRTHQEKISERVEGTGNQKGQVDNAQECMNKLGPGQSSHAKIPAHFINIEASLDRLDAGGRANFLMVNQAVADATAMESWSGARLDPEHGWLSF